MILHAFYRTLFQVVNKDVVVEVITKLETYDITKEALEVRQSDCNLETRAMEDLFFCLHLFSCVYFSFPHRPPDWASTSTS